MDVVGSEIGQKMRSAIKAKLTELGCYVDDELPDYVMVMVANKRTRGQMEEDLQLFLGENTELFVNWLHQVLKKLQEVTVAAPLKAAERIVIKDRSKSKDHKSKEKKIKEKDKVKKSESKKAKKKEKDKSHKKKIDKKIHKKKKSKQDEIKRPNIPPLLMNIEKDSEPSITDVFAGQILKNHGILLDEPKPTVSESKSLVISLIDPASIPSQSEITSDAESSNDVESVKSTPAELTRDEQIKEITAIEAKIHTLKEKLADQLDSMSADDDEFLSIRTEADELMSDLADDVIQEISEPLPVTPPLRKRSDSPTPENSKKPEPEKDVEEVLPQIELKLPKRPIRDRLGTRDKSRTESNDTNKSKDIERLTPEKVTEPQKTSKSQSRESSESQKVHSGSDTSTEKSDPVSKKITSKVSVLEKRPARSTCASVVRVRPRPRVAATASSLLMKAVADAHKSLLNIPPKIDPEQNKVQRALVRPMRRCVDRQNIVIQVPSERRTEEKPNRDADSNDDSSRTASETEKEYIPAPITKKFKNTEYVPSRRKETRVATKKDDTLIIETINIHNPSIDKDKNTKFIVTMDGYHPNAFLKKKLLDEGILNEEASDKPKDSSEDKAITKSTETIDKSVDPPKDNTNSEATEVIVKNEAPSPPEVEINLDIKEEDLDSCDNQSVRSLEKRLSNTSEESHTQVTIKEEEPTAKRKSIEIKIDNTPAAKKRKASPIVFDVIKKEKDVDEGRTRTESHSSDNAVTIVTTASSHKYDSLPPLSQTERKTVWCRAFPACRYGAACVFLHPRCKFAFSCTRRACQYSHPPASHVVPSVNYKAILPAAVSGMCKFYPNCVNPACHFYHPKPCRFGKNCINKLECNFYHSDVLI